MCLIDIYPIFLDLLAKDRLRGGIHPPPSFYTAYIHLKNVHFSFNGENLSTVKLTNTLKMLLRRAYRISTKDNFQDGTDLFI